MKKLNTLLLMIMLPVSSLVAAGASDPSAIDALNQNWGAALNSGKTSDLVNLYAKGAVMLPPTSQILSEPAAIKDYWEGLRKVGVNDYVISTVDLRIEGDTAYQTALWVATRKATDGNVIQFEGNMSNVLERQKDGSWKIKLQSWN